MFGNEIHKYSNNLPTMYFWYERLRVLLLRILTRVFAKLFQCFFAFHSVKNIFMKRLRLDARFQNVFSDYNCLATEI